VEKPYSSPYIARESQSEWVPQELESAIDSYPEIVKKAISQAEANGQTEVLLPGEAQAISLEQAKVRLADLEKLNACAKTVSSKAGKQDGMKKKLGLVVKPNIDQLDYEETANAFVGNKLPPPRLPSMKPGIQLKEHQLQGLSWLQHRFDSGKERFRGIMLADDMGLGKTVQILAFLASLLEKRAVQEPFLVVAPVALLDNWREEIDKFFPTGTFELSVLYGKELESKRLSQADIDEQLRGHGITRLLRKDWLGSANLVLTTYETLRDLEFSLAAQPWSVMVCDEAQKIKNPNVLATRAAKKQQVHFRIACTGTPVENTLVDLWCLFDFFQPGKLGSLRDFGGYYRRPIEAKTEEENNRVKELRAFIEPFILRRTKEEVARDLPRKMEDESCRTLEISPRQRELYAKAVADFRRQAAGEERAAAALTTLHRVRQICSDPTEVGEKSDRIAIAVLERDSPKMRWLLSQLASIRDKGEKVIVFCEFKDLQRTLQRAVRERLDIHADIVNGDTAVSAEGARSRHQRIRAFQQRAGFGVIILSPLAVGFGVNIQAANHVIHFTRSWNPAREDQATDRAYRIGQTRDCHVYCPTVVAQDFRTFDVELDRLLQHKRKLSKDMLNGTGGISPSDFMNDFQGPEGKPFFDDCELNLADVEKQKGSAFEIFCALLWEKQGFVTRQTGKPGDGGVDVVAWRDKNGVLIQCKSSGNKEKKLDWEAVKDVVTGAAYYERMYPGVSFKQMAITHGKFNSGAHEQAALNGVKLVEGKELAQLLEQFPVRRSEMDARQLPGWNLRKEARKDPS
ncbi:MAG: restriction endonuclease, partial [Magnetococcales bacterium]|nr:restriction endonuclease [Magnetococcales bacterium]